MNLRKIPSWLLLSFFWQGASLHRSSILLVQLLILLRQALPQAPNPPAPNQSYSPNLRPDHSEVYTPGKGHWKAWL